MVIIIYSEVTQLIVPILRAMPPVPEKITFSKQISSVIPVKVILMRIPALFDGICEPPKLNPRIVEIPELTDKPFSSDNPPEGIMLLIPVISN